MNLITQQNLDCSVNKLAYESDEALTLLDQRDTLQKPEEAVLNRLREELSEMRMLDLGIGAGRTTVHFAPLVKKYTGVDYSNFMIRCCGKKFQNCRWDVSFAVLDARNMTQFKPQSFDFILFSFNGIDYVEHEDRIKILNEIRRLLRKDGYFCFSTHNLNYWSYWPFHLSKNPSLLIKQVNRLLQMRLLNRRVWKLMRNHSEGAQYAMVNDGALDFKMVTYYITPLAQLKQLSASGFYDTEIYSLRDGAEVKKTDENIDQWLYYLTKVAS